MKDVPFPLVDAAGLSMPPNIRPCEPTSLAIIPFAFTPQQCAELQHMLDGGSRIGALAGGHAAQTIRDCHVKWLDDNFETDWLFQKLARLAADVNRSHFHFELEGFSEGLQLIRYDTADIAYDWHIDIGRSGATQSRKLSVSVQLSDESDYMGGALELNPSGDIFSAPRDQGTAIFFPSYMLHRVAPITSGHRHALVAWIHGPAFR